MKKITTKKLQNVYKSTSILMLFRYNRRRTGGITLFWTKKKTKLLASVLLSSYIATGMGTAVSTPQDIAQTVQMAQPEMVEGVSAKGYVEMPENANWEEVQVLISNPSGETQLLTTEFDDQSETFQFEQYTDETGTWKVEELQIVEDGQTVYQTIENVEMEVYDSVETAYEEIGAQIVTNTLDYDVYTEQSFLQALTGLYAVDSNGEFIPIEITVAGEYEQHFTFFNDGVEFSSSDPIDLHFRGPFTLTLAAEGAETMEFSLELSDEIPVVTPVSEEEILAPALIDVRASVEEDELIVDVQSDKEINEEEYLIPTDDAFLQDEEGVSVYWGAPEEGEAPAGSTISEERRLKIQELMSYSPQPAPDTAAAIRIAGSRRFETAVAASQTGVYRSEFAILVSSQSYPDALAATSLSRVFNAPMLYSGETSLNAATLKELQRIGSKTVLLIGGTSAISPAVATSLQQEGFKVERIAGNNRFETALKIGTKLKDQYNPSTALVVNGSTTSDALVAGAYASHYGSPILYTQKDSMDAASVNFLKANYKNVIIVGGPASVSDKVKGALEKAGLSVSRAAGENRYLTATDFAKRHFPGSTRVVLASGADEKLADGLVGGTLGGFKCAPVLLVKQNDIMRSVADYMRQTPIHVAYILGGVNTIEKSVLDSAKSLLKPTEKQILDAIKEANPDPVDDKKPANPTVPLEDPIESGPIKPIVEDPIAEAWKDGKIRILIDPGHGWNYNQGVDKSYFEGNQMMYFGFYLQRELKKYGVEAHITRMPEGKFASAYEALLWEKDYAQKNKHGSINNQIYSLEDRGSMAEGYDLLLSVHSNAPFDIAASEIFDDVNSPNKELAEQMLDTITDTFKHSSRGVKYRYNTDGTNWYGVLRNSKATNALLIEHGFHTSTSDVKKLLDFDFLQKLAKAEAETIANYYGIK